MGISATNARDPGIPAIYLHTLARLLGEMGLDATALLLAVGLDPNRLNATERRVCRSQANEFITRAMVESGEPGLGVLLARELRLPLHGVLGSAAMSSQTLEEAFELVTRYLGLRVPGLDIRKQYTGGYVYYQVTCDYASEPLQRFIMDTLLFGWALISTQLAGAPVQGMRILRRGPEPGYLKRLIPPPGIAITYQASGDALVVPASQLGRQIRFSNPELAVTSRAQCESAWRQLSRGSGFSLQVKQIIDSSHPFPARLTRVAGILFVSERTLKRRLHEEHASFQALVDEVRLERSRELLGDSRIKLSQVASRLGYADAANFTRAFKRWTGVSPSEFRSGKSPWEPAR